MVRDMKGKRPQYFEATLQLRNPTQEIVTFVEEEIHKALLAYINALYDFSPFGENRKSLAKAVLDELAQPTDKANDWIASLFEINEDNKEIPKQQAKIDAVSF